MALGTFKNFGNNIVLEKMDYRMAGNFTDENKLLNLLQGGDSLKAQHLGVLTLFNQMQLVNTPLLKMTELAKNTLYVNGDDGEFTFDVPYTLEMPTIREDLTGDNATPGIDGQTFELLIGDGNLDPIMHGQDVALHGQRAERGPLPWLVPIVEEDRHGSRTALDQPYNLLFIS